MVNLKAVDEALSRGEFHHDLINAFHVEYAGWKLARANVVHTDMFDAPIKPGQMYFKRQAGPGFADVDKLTLESMQRTMQVAFGQNTLLVKLARQRVQDREVADLQAMKDAMDVGSTVHSRPATT